MCICVLVYTHVNACLLSYVYLWVAIQMFSCRRGGQILRIEAILSCESSDTVIETNQEPLQEQRIFLTTETTLQSQDQELQLCVCVCICHSVVKVYLKFHSLIYCGGRSVFPMPGCFLPL